MEKQTVQFRDLGTMEYKAAWDYQEQLLKENAQIKSVISQQSAVGSKQSGLMTADCELTTAHYLLFVEHPPVYTLGKSGSMENVLINEEMRSIKGIEFFRTNRGGDITFHGPQ